MKMLVRLCSAAVLVATVAACGGMPTAAQPDSAWVRRDGGITIGGGHRSVEGDTLASASYAQVRTMDACEGVTERGGGMFGGGSVVAPAKCE